MQPICFTQSAVIPWQGALWFCGPAVMSCIAVIVPTGIAARVIHEMTPVPGPRASGIA